MVEYKSLRSDGTRKGTSRGVVEIVELVFISCSLWLPTRWQMFPCYRSFLDLEVAIPVDEFELQKTHERGSELRSHTYTDPITDNCLAAESVVRGARGD
jgi:hypothetical protein